MPSQTGAGNEARQIWTVAGGKDNRGESRPALILKEDRFDMTGSITVCAFPTDPTDGPLFRLHIEPDDADGLRVVCRLMVDKITTVL
jgi:mRNA interferase MazF